VREIARVLKPDGECRVMVYNRSGMPARITLIRHHVLGVAFLRQTFDETLTEHSDGASARFYSPDQLEDLFAAFFKRVSVGAHGQDSDVIPLPARLRRLALMMVPEAYVTRAQKDRGAFLLVIAFSPIECGE
jgi:hypothetical protein